MSSVQDEIREIQGRVSQAQARKTRAEVEQETAQTNLDTAIASLKEEFGVTDNEGIKRVHAEITAERDAALAQIRTELENAGV